MPGSAGLNYGVQVGRAVTQRLGGRWTPEKARFFQAWARAEGTQAGFNPFATTRKGYTGETVFNSAGVKNYPNLATGIKATVDTLSLDYYTHIVKLLRSDNVTAKDLASAVAASPWGTGTGVLRVLGVTQSDGYDRATSTAQYGTKKGQIEEQYQTIALDRFRPSEAYASTLEKLGTVSPSALQAIKGFQPLQARIAVPVQTEAPDQPTPFQPKQPVGAVSDGFLQLPTSWKGTHVTDNLGWGSKTAEDIMGSPGTAVGAPEDGVVVYWHPTGAQGGGSMLIRTASGREYWLGHIANGLAAGTKFTRGTQLATISADHPRPHVHVDVRKPSRKGKKK